MSLVPPIEFPAWPADGPAWIVPVSNTTNPRVKADRSWHDENPADWSQRHERSRAPAEVPVSDWTGPRKTGPGPA